MADTQQTIKAVKDFLETDYTYGDIVPHEWFHEHFGIGSKPYLTKDAEKWQLVYTTALSCFRAKMLEEYLMDFRSVSREGYQIVQPEQQVNLALKDTRKDVTKALRQGSKRITSVNMEGQSDAKRIEQTEALAFVGQVQSMTRKKLWK